MIQLLRFVMAGQGGEMRFLVNSILIIILACLFASQVHAKQIYVKYRGPVDTDNGHFHTYNLKSSSLVYEIFYDRPNSYLLVNLKGTFYHYCSIPSNVVNSWVSAPSLGRFYLGNIKGNYDCRIYPFPDYKK